MNLELNQFMKPTRESERRVQVQSSFSNLPSPMLAKKGSPSMLTNPNLFAETKWDGTRVLLVKRGNNVRVFVARGNHTEYTHRYPQLVSEGKKLRCDSCILDGEFVFYEGDSDFFLNISATDNTIGSKKFKYMVFDILEKDGENLRSLPIEIRKEHLNNVVPTLSIIRVTKVHHSNKDEFFQDQLAKGKEGVILKVKGSSYSGGRSNSWFKIKRTASYDVIAKGGTKGTGARIPYFGAVHCFLPDKQGKLRHIGDVGSGFNDNDLMQITPLVRSNKPFVIEVKFMEWTKPDYKMRFPVFLRLRTDKTVEDVTSSHD